MLLAALLACTISRAKDGGGISRTGGRDQAVRAIKEKQQKNRKQQTDRQTDRHLTRRGMPTSSRRTRERGVASCSMLRTRLMWPLKVDKLCCRFWLSPTSARTLSKNTTLGCCCCCCCLSDSRTPGFCDSCCCCSCCLSDICTSACCDPCCCCWLDCWGSGCCASCSCCC